MLSFVALFSYVLLTEAAPANSTLYVPKWNKFLQNQNILIKDLFQDYNAEVSPVYTNIDMAQPLGYDPLAPGRFNYTILLYTFKLVGVIEPEERITVVMEVSEFWYDPRLTWDAEKYGNITNLHVRQEKIWSPTLTGYALNELVDLRDQDFRMAGIANTGEVYTTASVVVSANCAMKVARFPFDSQTCQIRFSMPIFFAKQVEILSDIYSGIRNETLWHEMGNSEWDLVNLTNRVDLEDFTDNQGNIELAVFELKVKRNPMYYIYMIVFPSFIINVLSIIGVFMRNSDTMSKLNVGLTNIMTMTFILGVMADKIPKTGNIPLLGIYIIINLVIMIIAVGITVGIVELRKYAIKKWTTGKNGANQRVLYFLGDPLETICIVLLEVVTIANFTMMIVFWIVDVPEWNDFLDHQSLLLTDLFRDYDGTVSPIYTKRDLSKPNGYNPLAPDRWNYTVFLYYMKLVEVVEPEEKVTVVFEMAEYWHDPRLAWDPNKYGNITMLHMRQDKIWSPTLSSFGINDIVDFRDQDFRLVCVESTGHVYDSLSARISVNCRMKVGRFPFDSQTCTVQFCLPIFNEKLVKIDSLIYPGILNKTLWEAMGNSEWDLINLTNRIDTLAFNDNFGGMELATFEIKIRRNPMYYIYMIVFPSYIINVLSIIGVFMKKSDKMSQLNVGLTNIMTMTFILGVMSDKIPKTGNIPLLGIYIIINLFIMITAVGLTIGIGELRKWAIPKLKGKERKMSKSLEFLLGDVLETILVIAMEILTTANFLLMIGYWITDG